MDIGKLRHRVTLQTVTETADGFGGASVQTWADTATLWGEVRPLTGREFANAHLLQGEISTRIRLRYRAGIVPKQRITWDGHTYDIIAVLDIGGRKREFELMCKELV